MKNKVINNEKFYNLNLLIFLNLFDGIVTYIGLELGFYVELNNLLNIIYKTSQNLFIFIKIIIPTIILITLCKISIKNISSITKMFILIANITYIMIFIYHIILITIL